MPNTIQLVLTEDENEIVLDALDADLEDYVEAAKEARKAGNADDAASFSEAAERVGALIAKLRPNGE